MIATVKGSGIDSVELIVDEKFLPAWFIQDSPAHLPVPPAETHALEGKVIAWGEKSEQRIPLASICDGKLKLQYEWDVWKQYIKTESYHTLAQPLYTRLPFHYHHVPEILRNLFAGMMLSSRDSGKLPRKTFPAFPIEQGFELLQYLVETLSSDEKAVDTCSQIILTHDIDTVQGFEWVKETATLEMEHGFKSLWNVVGCRYEIDFKTLDWLAENDFEIGLHGYNHDNKLVFLTKSEIQKRMELCLPLIQRYHMKSFRSPSWFRNRHLFEVIKDYFTCDYSYLDTDIVCPGGIGGCLTTREFMFQGLKHIPTTIPYEVPVFLDCKPVALADFWQPKIDWLRACGGNIVVNTHPDPHYSGNQEMLKSYRQLLESLKN